MRGKKNTAAVANTNGETKVSFDGAMLSNLRQAFIAKYENTWQGTDDQLHNIIKNVGTLETAHDTDEAIIYEMQHGGEAEITQLETANNDDGDQLSETQSVAIEGNKEIVITEETQEVAKSELFEHYENAFAENQLDEDKLRQAVEVKKITADEYTKITGQPYEPSSEAIEAAKGLRTGIGGNNSPVQDADQERVLNAITAFKPTYTKEEARDAVIAAVQDYQEHRVIGETSIRSKLSLTIANYVYYNTENVAANGNKILHVNRGMYNDVLKQISTWFATDELDSTAKSLISTAVREAILIMSGRLVEAWFVLPAGRRRITQDDAGSTSLPSLKDGERTLKGVAIRYKDLKPKMKVGSTDVWVENPIPDQLVLAPSTVTNALWESLWDNEGKLTYDVLTGQIEKFMAGKDVDKEAKNAKALAEKEKAKADALIAAEQLRKVQAGEITKEEYKALTGKDATATPVSNTPAGEVQGRETAGSQSEAVETSFTTLTQILNQEGAKEGDWPKLKEGVASLIYNLRAKERENEHLMRQKAGDITSAIPALGSVIREKGLPENLRIAYASNTNQLIKRVVATLNKAPSRQEAMLWRTVYRSLDAVFTDGEDALVYKNVDGVSETYAEK